MENGHERKSWEIICTNLPKQQKYVENGIGQIDEHLSCGKGKLDEAWNLVKISVDFGRKAGKNAFQFGRDGL